MALSKKHFKAITDILHQQILTARVSRERVDAVISVTDALVVYFATENPNFDAARFRHAVYDGTMTVGKWA